VAVSVRTKQPQNMTDCLAFCGPETLFVLCITPSRRVLSCSVAILVASVRLKRGSAGGIAELGVSRVEYMDTEVVSSPGSALGLVASFQPCSDAFGAMISGKRSVLSGQIVGVHSAQGWALASRRVQELIIYSPAKYRPKTLRSPDNIAHRPVEDFRDTRWKGLHVCQQILRRADTVLEDRTRELLRQKELISGDMGVQIAGGGLLMSRLDRQGVHFHTPSTTYKVSSSQQKPST
jgi:hypothetical protein